jgi:glycosyltransferase involved in cell wall biosynthesis
MKRVLVEMEKLKNPNSGLGQFCINVGEQFQQLKPADLELDFYLPSVQKNIFGEDINYVKHTPFHKVIPMSTVDYDVWHCLQQDSYYLPTSKKTKLILTIHDLNFLEKYKGSKQKRKLKSLQKRVDRASAITVISKFTEMIVRENLELNDKPVYVITNGNSLRIIEDAAIPKFIKFDVFIFSIGIISPKKNFHSLLPLLQNNKQLHLVIAGNNNADYAHQLIKSAKQMNVAEQLHLPGIINDDEKYWLYKNCKAFVLPSLTEGFGLPVVEAMSLGKPVFLSNLTSLPEVGGPEAHYWKSFEPQLMIETFEKGLKDFNQEKAKRSIEWTKQFSWENSAKEYLNLYRTL